MTDADGVYDLPIAGGQDHKVGRAEDGSARVARLRSWARTRFPMMGKLDAYGSIFQGPANGDLAAAGEGDQDVAAATPARSVEMT
jgi:hypothetical protein